MVINNKPIGVSILCLAYNHEQFIADAIDGFLMQKTSFPFEIIIHEDASTDGTANIIRTYEEKYPGIIKPIYQTENQYSKGININTEFMLPLAKGKYVALCDGDDYWTDPLKLQKQYDALESHPDCLMCLHKVLDYNALAEEKQKKKYLPKLNLQSGVVSSDTFFDIVGNGDFFNEVCYFFNAEAYKEYQSSYPKFAQLYMKNKTDDMPMLLYFGNKANVYYISDKMAVYRRFNVGSWSSSQTKKSKEQMAAFFKNSVEAIDEFHKFSNNTHASQMNYIRRFFQFNYFASTEQYREMLSSEFDCVWIKQSKKYKTRIKLLSDNRQLWGLIFDAYDRVKHLKNIFLYILCD